jgi:hypothetical protein
LRRSRAPAVVPPLSKRYTHVFKGLHRQIWTENKARMIGLYLRLFVYITKHGAYIVGFAGPQEPDMPEMWTAKLVLELEPKRLRQFFSANSTARATVRSMLSWHPTEMIPSAGLPPTARTLTKPLKTYWRQVVSERAWQHSASLISGRSNAIGPLSRPWPEQRLG